MRAVTARCRAKAAIGGLPLEAMGEESHPVWIERLISRW